MGLESIEKSADGRRILWWPRARGIGRRTGRQGITLVADSGDRTSK